jgi:hypothetical protein
LGVDISSLGITPAAVGPPENSHIDSNPFSEILAPAASLFLAGQGSVYQPAAKREAQAAIRPTREESNKVQNGGSSRETMSTCPPLVGYQYDQIFIIGGIL